MDSLRQFVVKLVVAVFAILVIADPLDDILLGNRWKGCPGEMYPLVGAIVAAMFTAEALRKKNGKGES